MKHIRITAQTISDSTLKQVKSNIQQGNVCLLPTDTCYILAANGLNQVAVKRVFELKNRPQDKPVHVNVASLTNASKYVYFNETANRLAGKFFPGAITLVLKKKPIVPDVLTGGKDTLGIRIPNHPFTLALTSYLKTPYTTTSANISGETTPYSVEDALDQLDESMIDLTIDVGRLPQRPTSTLVDVTTTPPQILREGAIPSNTIFYIRTSRP